MSWVKDALKELRQGRAVQVRPIGGSMRGRIESSQLVTLVPVDPAQIRIGDAVLVRWKGNFLLHLVTAIQGDRYEIGNNLGKINGTVAADDLLGMVTAVSD